MIWTRSSRAELSCLNDNKIKVYFFAANENKDNTWIVLPSSNV